MTAEQFRYHSGEVVREGDRVICEGRWYGVVQWVSLPGTPQAEAELNPDGGVFIAQNIRGVLSLSGHQAPFEDGNVAWKTTVFLRRGRAVKLGKGGTEPWPYEPGPYGGGMAPDLA